MVMGQYVHPVPLCVGLGLALVGANLYFRLGGYAVGMRLGVLVVAAPLMYFAMAGMYTIFACLCGCYECSVQRRRWLGAIWVASAAAVPYAASWWPFDLVLSEAFRGLTLPEVQHWLAIPSSVPRATAFYAAPLVFPVLAAAVLAWCGKGAAGPPSDAEVPTEESGTPAGGERRGFWRNRLEVPLALVLFMALADLVTFDRLQRNLLEVEANCQQQRWDEALAWADKLPLSDARAYDPRIIYCINRSLYFEGRLLERMFAYPQAKATPSLTLMYQDIEMTARLTPEQCSEIFFDLGRINEAEQMTHEALEHCGNRPELLKRMVWIYVIKGEPEAARRYLEFLERSLLDGVWAHRVRVQLDADPGLSGLPLIAEKRQLAVEQDSLNDANDLERLLQTLLERNPRNRMALEYLMAHYLLTRQVDRLASDRYRFDALDYPRFPRHIEEALTVYAAMAGLKELDLGSRSLQGETWQRFNEFIGLERQSQGDPAVAFEALSGYRDSYFYFFVFGHNISALGVARPRE
ncbi:MAG: DUF6057 family protein [Thermoguttaceae bacterium]